MISKLLSLSSHNMPNPEQSKADPRKPDTPVQAETPEGRRQRFAEQKEKYRERFAALKEHLTTLQKELQERNTPTTSQEFKNIKEAFKKLNSIVDAYYQGKEGFNEANVAESVADFEKAMKNLQKGLDAVRELARHTLRPGEALLDGRVMKVQVEKDQILVEENGKTRALTTEEIRRMARETIGARGVTVRGGMVMKMAAEEEGGRTKQIHDKYTIPDRPVGTPYLSPLEALQILLPETAPPSPDKPAAAPNKRVEVRNYDKRTLTLNGKPTEVIRMGQGQFGVVEDGKARALTDAEVTSLVKENLLGKEHPKGGTYVLDKGRVLSSKVRNPTDPTKAQDLGFSERSALEILVFREMVEINADGTSIEKPSPKGTSEKSPERRYAEKRTLKINGRPVEVVRLGPGQFGRMQGGNMVPLNDVALADIYIENTPLNSGFERPNIEKGVVVLENGTQMLLHNAVDQAFFRETPDSPAGNGASEKPAPSATERVEAAKNSIKKAIAEGHVLRITIPGEGSYVGRLTKAVDGRVAFAGFDLSNGERVNITWSVEQLTTGDPIKVLDATPGNTMNVMAIAQEIRTGNALAERAGKVMAFESATDNRGYHYEFKQDRTVITDSKLEWEVSVTKEGVMTTKGNPPPDFQSHALGKLGQLGKPGITSTELMMQKDPFKRITSREATKLSAAPKMPSGAPREFTGQSNPYQSKDIAKADARRPGEITGEKEKTPDEKVTGEKDAKMASERPTAPEKIIAPAETKSTAKSVFERRTIKGK